MTFIKSRFYHVFYTRLKCIEVWNTRETGDIYDDQNKRFWNA